MTENGSDVLTEVEGGTVIVAKLPWKAEASKHSIKIGRSGETTEEAAKDDCTSGMCV